MANGVRGGAVREAENYYDSSDADNFYFLIWGGEDIHIGIYEQNDEPVKSASRRTVERMAGRIKGLSRETKLLDIGAGYGGAARFVAERYGAHVTCLNLSKVENERNRRMSAQQNLADRVSVVHGSFEDIPEPDGTFDVVWSQDAILHSGNRMRVLEEVARVLKPGGQFIFTDPMQSDTVKDTRVLQPIYDRIHLESLGSPGFYRENLAKLGFVELSFDPMLEQLRTHYARIREELAARRASLGGHVSTDYIDRMIAGLGHWVEGADRGDLAWGIFHFQKN